MEKLAANEALNDLLGYEGLQIIQRNDMLNFSLDSVLLAQFVSIPLKSRHIVDLGTGNAPIPLFLSTRTRAQITGVELQPEAVELARRNVKLNRLTEQIAIIEHDIRTLRDAIPHQSVDVVVSNPPFFKVTEKRQQNENKLLTIARHEVCLDLETLIKEAGRILDNNGYFALVHRPDRLIEIIDLLKRYRLEPKRLQLIHPKHGSDANILLIEARKNGGKGLKILPAIIAHDETGDYSAEVLKLFKRV